MFESVGVMNRKELRARNEVKWETYTKKIQIEARVLGDLVMNHIVPVATKYQSKLIDNVYKMQSIFPAEEANRPVGPEPGHHPRDSRAHQLHQGARGQHGGGTQGGQPHHRRAREGRRPTTTT